MPTTYTANTAKISDCGRFRFLLQRQWEPSRNICAFVGLNPSTADATLDDPTIRRCVNFAAYWGYGSLLMLNLVAYRATDPKDMFAWLAANPDDDWAAENAATAREAFSSADIVIGAWGAPGAVLPKYRQAMIDAAGDKLYSLALTKSGEPRHPLYLKGDLRATPYRGNNG